MIKTLLIILLAAPYILAAMQDEWVLVTLDDATTNGIPLIHDYVLINFHEKLN